MGPSLWWWCVDILVVVSFDMRAIPRDLLPEQHFRRLWFPKRMARFSGRAARTRASRESRVGRVAA